MAAAASRSLHVMEEREALGRGPWNLGQPSNPGWGGFRGQLGGGGICFPEER